jgi:hypothetical protein
MANDCSDAGRRTREQRATAVVARLCDIFGCQTPTVLCDPQLLRRGCRGAYYPDGCLPDYGPLIALAPRKHDQETVIHEFAHHLDRHYGHGSNEPPRSLVEVRAVVCPGSDGSATLRYRGMRELLLQEFRI